MSLCLNFQKLSSAMVILMMGFILQGKARLLPNFYETPSNLVSTCFHQDEAGFIWVGTRAGLYQFDGSNWINFQRTRLNKDTVSAIASDPTGTIWVGYQNGAIHFLENQELVPFEPEEGLPIVPITGFQFDRNGAMWFSTYGEGVYFFDQNRLYNLDSDDGLPSNDVYDIQQDSMGRIWAATDQGIGICSWENNQKHVEILKRKNGLPDEFVSSISTQVGRQLYIGTYGKGLAVYDFQTQVISPLPGWNGDPIIQVIPLEDEIWLLAENSGIWHWDGDRYHQEQLGDISAFFLDRQMNFWWQERKDGLFGSPAYMRHYLPEVGVVKGISLDANDQIWLVNGDTLYQGLTPGQFEKIPLPKDVIPSALYADPLQNIWMGTMKQGIWQWSESRKNWKNFTPKNKSSCPPILSITRKENKLWMATFGGAYSCSINHHQFLVNFSHYDQADGLGINYIYQAIKDQAGRIWLATDGHGAGIWDDALNLIPQLQDNTIYSITETPQGKIWMSTDKGDFYSWKDDQIQAFTHRNSEDWEILSITALGEDELLLIHANGIARWNSLTQQITSLSDIPNFPEIGGELNLSIKDKNQNIWIGTQSGIIEVLPRLFPSSFQPLPLLISAKANLESVRGFSRKYDHDENNWIFEYTGLWYQAPEAVQYRHRLLGLQDQWEISQNSRVSFPKLAPGKYEFQLQTSTNPTFDSAKTLTFEFEIKPPYWATFWFWVLATMVIGSIGWGWISYREKSIRKAEENHRQQIEHKFNTLRSQINPHFLFNSFNTLAGVIEEEPRSAVSYVERLSDFFRSILVYRNQSVISIKEELDLLENYLFLQSVRYRSAFSARVNVPKPYYELQIPPLTLQLLAENALKHNVASQRSPLQMEVFTDEHGYIIIRNNLQLRTTKASSTQFGLANIRENYRYLTRKDVQINQTATSFEIRLPLLTPKHA